MTGWARCNFDGKPVHPDDAAKARDFGAFLTARKAGARDLQWRELIEGEPPCTYWRNWYCPLPPLRSAWRQVSAGWGEPGPDGIPVWCVYAIALPPVDVPG